MSNQASPHDMITDRAQASDFAEKLYGLIVSLMQVLDRETEAIHKGAYGKGHLIDDAKSDLMLAYRHALQDVQANRDTLSRFVPVRLDDLRKLNAQFQHTLQRNLAAVSTAKAISEQLLSRLAKQAATTKTPKSYGANGAMCRPRQTSSLTIDRSL